MATEKTEKTAKPAEGLKSERGEVKPEDQIAPLVASPSGPSPLSAFAGTKEEAEELRERRLEQIEEERAHPRASEYIDEETLERLSHAERRAIATQRGYQLPRGRRLSAKQLASMQHEDENLEMPQSGAKRGKGTSKKD